MATVVRKNLLLTFRYLEADPDSEAVGYLTGLGGVRQRRGAGRGERGERDRDANQQYNNQNYYY